MGVEFALIGFNLQVFVRESDSVCVCVCVRMHMYLDAHPCKQRHLVHITHTHVRFNPARIPGGCSFNNYPSRFIVSQWWRTITFQLHRLSSEKEGGAQDGARRRAAPPCAAMTVEAGDKAEGIFNLKGNQTPSRKN